ncbi:MAG: ABC transporter substrate-binding protein [Proteobacteria bacterium]|nr:ABC transporter substrate-binding protein [Pseudomonadota bacterium]
MKRRIFLGTTAGLLTAPWLARAQAVAKGGYGVGVIAPPALPPGFQSFPYVNLNAPKGGAVTFSEIGGFDSFNPFIIRGTPAAGANYIWDTLMRQSDDEAAVAYGLLAESVALAPDNRSVTFTLRGHAKFSDGSPVLASDVVWTFQTLCTKGQPFYQQYYAAVSSAEARGDRQVVFHLRAGAPREMPLILGALTVMPQAWWKGRDFTAPLIDAPLGSGPYKVEASALNRSVSYSRRADYWGADLPVCRGFYNFDRITYEYFGDPAVAFQAFKAGDIDFRNENIAKNWATGYDFPAVKKGLVDKQIFADSLPTGMQGFGMNTRRAVFKDPRVRQAMAWAYDFQWANKVLFYGSYQRTLSYFSNSPLACSGTPSGAELALLEPFRAELPPELFTKPFTLPVNDGSGNNRPALIAALHMLEQAGWTVQNRQMKNAAGEPLKFEILLNDPSFERVTLPYAQDLKRLGVDVSVRVTDPSEYQQRMDNFDFDMTVVLFPESDVPGDEQRDYWGSAAAKLTGSNNLTGVASPVVDALVDKVINASDMAELLAATHALDRVLLWGWYVVPQWHLGAYRLAFWNVFGYPKVPMRAGFDIDTWWIDETLARATDEQRHHSNEV